MKHAEKTFGVCILIGMLLLASCSQTANSESQKENADGNVTVSDFTAETYDGTEGSLLKRYPKLQNSEDDQDFIKEQNVKKDFDGNGESETLSIKVADGVDDATSAECGGETNCPVTISLTIKDSAVKYQDPWNDGVKLYVTDFDTNDPYKDICLIHCGTDVSFTAYIYRYDGKSISEYAQFDFYQSDLLYDGKGKIYFYSTEPTEGYFSYFDFEKKQVERMQ